MGDNPRCLHTVQPASVHSDFFDKLANIHS
jgi:hypothetical protein